MFSGHVHIALASTRYSFSVNIGMSFLNEISAKNIPKVKPFISVDPISFGTLDIKSKIAKRSVNYSIHTIEGPS